MAAQQIRIASDVRQVLIDRFEEKFIPEPNSGCWLWIGAFKKSEYGSFRIGANKITSHRASWLLYRGPLNQEWVLHRCDNRACVNPDHLFLGDAAANAADRDRKLRGQMGASSYRAKVTLEQAREIFADKRPLNVIAAAYGVSKGAVSHIKAGRSWAHFNKGKNLRGLIRGEDAPWSKLTEQSVRQIRSDPRAHHLIAKDFGISRSCVGLIKHRVNWGHVDD